MGQSARLLRTLTLADIQAFAAVSGDTNPTHLNSDYANDTLFHGVIAHGMWGGALISALLGTNFPGPGTIYVSQDLHFTKPVRIGDTLTVTATVVSKDDSRKRVELACQAVNQRGESVLHGVAQVIAPTQKVRLPKPHAPQIQVFDPQARFRELLALGQGMPAERCAVVHPCDTDSLRGAMDAALHGLIIPVLIGPEARLRSVAEAAGIDLNGIELLPVEHSHAAARKAVELAALGDVGMLMKGSLHTDELMSAVVDREHGLRTKRRISHCFLLEAPAYPRPFIITDAAVNIQPTLAIKADIVQNAINLAHVIGVTQPKVALLAAVETVNADMEATLHAAALCKMADRGQITGGVLDGPLAFDNAVSAEAARIKGITSPVAGEADILVVPDLESGNMLAKQLEYLAGAHMAGIVLGAKLPIVLTSRADNEAARISSCALSVLLAHQYRQTPP